MSSFVGDKVAAGGHQGYAALGGLYTQARPMVPHLYGDLAAQAQQIPVTMALLCLPVYDSMLCIFWYYFFFNSVLYYPI